MVKFSMAALSGKPFSMLLISLVFMATLATTGKAQLLLPPLIFPFLPTPGLVPWQPGEIQKCWSSLATIRGCIMEIYTSFFRGQIGVIGPACCQAITQINNNCWPKMFPFNPFFPPLLRSSCSASTRSGTMNNVNKLSVPGLLPFLPGAGNEVKECWSSLNNIKGCLSEIYRAFPVGQISAIGIGTACCQAIITIKDNCWPKLFPLKPSLPPLLKDYCRRIDVSAVAAPNYVN